MSYGLPDGCTPADVDLAMDGEKPVVCECGHDSEQHADEDYDCVGDPPRFVAVPRPCSQCDCGRFWEES